MVEVCRESHWNDPGQVRVIAFARQAAGTDPWKDDDPAGL